MDVDEADQRSTWAAHDPAVLSRRARQYRLLMVATDAANNKSKPKHASFRVVLR